VPLYLKRPWRRLTLGTPSVLAFRQTLRVGKGQAARWGSAPEWDTSAPYRLGSSALFT
jgi:hypothetical protein